MELDQYARLRSPIHTWDARWKLIAIVPLIFVCAAVKSAPGLLCAALVSSTMVIISGLPIRHVLKILKAPFYFIIIMTPVLMLTSGGERLISWEMISVYRSGLYIAARLAIKALSIMLLFICLFGTARLQESMKAMEFFKLPPILLSLLFFTYRYIFLYLEEFGKLLTAARLRGYTLLRGLKGLKSTVSILVTLLIRSYEQSERVYAAMRLRGYTGAFPTLCHFKTQASDVLKTSLLLSLSVLIVYMDVL